MIRQNKALSSQTLIRRLPSTCDENRLNKEVYGRILGQEIATATAARMRLEVDLSGIRHNAALILRISRGAKMMAVVKGNAYGLGASVVAGVLSTGGAHALAVDNVAEGIELRRDAISLPILVIDGDVPENASLAVRHKLMPGIPNEHLLVAYEQAAREAGVRYPVWLAVNVGFNRSGCRDLERFRSFAITARRCEHLHIRAVYAHLSTSDTDCQANSEQIREFEQVVKLAREIFGTQLEISLFASHGLIRFAESFPTNWVRPGILLYGEHNFVTAAMDAKSLATVQQFRPTIRLRARITHILQFVRREKVGYGQQHETRSGQRLATVAVGFGSGYPVEAKNLHAIVRGRRVRVFGEVGMDALQVDVTDITEVQPYDWVTLIGTDRGEHISVASLARDAGITPYQLMRRLQCKHSYIDNGNSMTAELVDPRKHT